MSGFARLTNKQLETLVGTLEQGMVAMVDQHAAEPGNPYVPCTFSIQRAARRQALAELESRGVTLETRFSEVLPS